jgi:serine phosphatase RsbU (regulator of sigma subunit)/anti-sigma regulatory factor (Ser/Thr protein kinase)
VPEPFPSFEHLADAMLSVDADWSVTYANAAARRMLGVGTDVVGRPLFKVWPRLAEEGYQDFLEDVLSSGRAATFSTYDQGGTARWRMRAIPTLEGPPGLALIAREANLAEQVSEVIDYTAALAEADTVPDIVEAIANAVLPAFGASGLLVAMIESGWLRLAGHVGYSSDAVAALSSLDLDGGAPIIEIMRERRPLFLPTRTSYLDRYPELRPLIDKTKKEAWAFLPLIVSGQPIGSLTVSYDASHDFRPEERSLIVSVGGLIAQTLARARLRESERSLAAEFQTHLLPRALPQPPGITATAHYVPATDGMGVGGDWYDLLELPDDRVGLVIGDVQGHNMRAAAVMGQLRNALRAYAAEGHDPSDVLSRTNRLMADLDPTLFATCCFLRLDLRTGTAEMAVAGHPAPLVRSGDRVRQLTVPLGPPLGIEPNAAYVNEPVRLEARDTVVLFTDGLLEELRRPYDEALRDLAETLRTAPEDLEEMADLLVARERGLRGRSDDVALLLVRLEGSAERSDHARTVVDRRDPRAARAARDFLAGFVPQSELEDIRETCVLLVSEVVTNALRHTDGQIHLAVWRYQDRMRIEVSDEEERPPVLGVTDLLDEAGRGVPLMDALADRWGTAPRGAGKVVWFELDIPCFPGSVT